MDLIRRRVSLVSVLSSPSFGIPLGFSFCGFLRFVFGIVLITMSSGCGYLLEMSKDLSASQSLAPQILPFVDFGQDLFINSTTQSLSWSLETSSSTASSYTIRIFAAANCSGVPSYTESVTTLNYTMTGLSNGSTNSVEIVPLGSASGIPRCSANYKVDLDAPALATWTTPAATAATVATGYTFQWSASDVGISGLKTSDMYFVELFSAGACAGSVTSSLISSATTLSLTGLVPTDTRSVRVTSYDRAGNVSSASCSPTLTIGASPTVALAAIDASPLLDAFLITINFSEAVTGVALADFTVGNGTAANLTGSGTSYSMIVTPTAEGTVTIALPAGAAENVLTLGNLASTTLSRSYLSPATVEFAVHEEVVSEGSGVANQSISITLDSARTYSVTVYYRLADFFSTAVNPTHHSIATSGSVVIPAGATAVALNFIYTGNTTANVDRILQLSLIGTDAPAVRLGTKDSYRRLIRDDDTVFQSLHGSHWSTCGITTANVLKCWGSGQYSHVLPDPGVSYSFASQGMNHACGITTAGVLKCWGDNMAGQLGNGASGVSSVPPTVIDSGTNYSVVAAGQENSCAITTAGVLKCWGRGMFGTVGDGTYADRLSPVVVNAGTNYSKVSLGRMHGCGITTAGVLKCWGMNGNGQLGDISNTTRAAPVVIDSGVNYTSVSAGIYFTCGITTTNILKCWGQNSNSQLGDGTTAERTAPVVIDSGVTYSSVSTGEEHSCGITSTGNLKCWGKNSENQLGDGTTTPATTPRLIESGVPYSKVVAAGNFWGFSCGITVTKLLKCWGNNALGQLGDSTLTQRALPVVTDDGIARASVVSSGFSRNCAIMNGGSATNLLKCWGENSDGQIGDGSYNQRDSPVAIDSTKSYLMVSAGYRRTCGITTEYILKCWGYGGIGDGTSTTRNLPTIIDPGVAYAHVFAAFHICGITTAGVLKCWGYNNVGQVGDGTTTTALSPIIIDPGVTYKHVHGVDSTTCGVTTTNVLKCWGGNTYGQVGDGTTTNRLTPTVIDSGVSYSKAFSANSSCAITTTGVLKCWGENNYGQVGNGAQATGLTVLNPAVIDSGVTYSEVMYADGKRCGITTAGVMKCWGYSGGVCPGVNYCLTPTVVDAATTYRSVGVGKYHLCGSSSQGVIKCWGGFYYGAIGLGQPSYQASPIVVDTGLVYSKVAAQTAVCGILSAGGLKCWGSQGVGDGTNLNRSAATIVDVDTQYSKISTGGLFSSVACGITAAGVLKCWGNNNGGILGDGTTTTRLRPVIVDPGVSYAGIYVGLVHACGITTTGLLKCWGGDNNNGEMGDGSSGYLVPTVIDSGTLYSRVAASGVHTCGITTLGVLKCWGGNGTGSLGTGNTTDSPTPIVIDSGTTYSEIAAGGATFNAVTCGITTLGVLKCWGSTEDGQVGSGVSGFNAKVLTPTVIDSGVSYSRISIGAEMFSAKACGITTAGVLKCWGGPLVGDGSLVLRATPVVVNSGTTYSEVSAGAESRSCAVTTAGVLKCWGREETESIGRHNPRATLPISIVP